jgi:hypothetical protein
VIASCSRNLALAPSGLGGWALELGVLWAALLGAAAALEAYARREHALQQLEQWRGRGRRRGQMDRHSRLLHGAAAGTGGGGEAEQVVAVA